MWQKCPICNGTGSITPVGISDNSLEKCPTCKGKRIIHADWGVPPNWGEEIMKEPTCNLRPPEVKDDLNFRYWKKEGKTEG